MSKLQRIKSFINEDVTLFRLLKTLVFLGIIFLFLQTWGFWQTLFKYTFKSLKPFLIGFIIAYTLSPLVKFLEDRGVKRGIAIFLILAITIMLFMLVIFNLVPMLYDEFSIFINSINRSIDMILKWYQESFVDPSEILEGILNQLNTTFGDLQNNALDFFKVLITNIISGSISFLTTMIFSIAIAIYMLADFDKFKLNINNLANKVSLNLPIYLKAIDKNMSVYLKSSIILMTIYFIEYTFIFFIMGHKAYLMIGVLYILATFVPYIGGMIVTVIGILTGLTLPKANLIILIILVMIMSQIDGYVTSPYVYKKGVKIEPLTSLLIVFVGSAFFGALGIMLSMPIYVMIRAVYNVRKENEDLDIKELDYE